MNQSKQMDQYDIYSCGNNITNYEYRQTLFCDATVPPASVINLISIGVTRTNITYLWTNPDNVDYNSTIILLDSVNIINKSSAGYTATNLECETQYNLTIYTKDNNGNINTSGVTNLTTTLECPDIDAPIFNIQDIEINFDEILNQSLNITDNRGIESVWVNDSRFEISGQDYLRSANLSADVYRIKIYANDTSNNTNFTEIIVNVTHDCGSTVNRDLTLLYDIDCGSSNGLSIDEDNIMIDCNGHSLTRIPGFGPDSMDYETTVGGYNGILISGNANITIRNCKITGFDTGVYVSSSEGLNITDNEIYANIYSFEPTSSEFEVAGGISYTNIYLYDVINSRISNNIINDSCEGLMLHNSYYNTIKNNVIKSNQECFFTGIYNYAESHNNYLINNNMSNNGEYGVYSTAQNWTWNITSDIIVENNDIYYYGSMPEFIGGSIQLINDSYIHVNNKKIPITNRTIKSIDYTEQNVSANTSTDIVSNSSNTTLTVFVGNNVSVALAVAEGDTPTKTGSVGLKSIEINVDDATKGNISWVFIKVYYTDAEIAAAGVEESTLRIWYYNETSGTWQQETNSGVDTTLNYVWANLTHLSEFGLFGSAPVVDSGTSGGSSGGGGGGGGSGSTVVFQCGDGLDNDNDGFIDMIDPGCLTKLDNNESDGWGETQEEVNETEVQLSPEEITEEEEEKTEEEKEQDRIDRLSEKIGLKEGKMKKSIFFLIVLVLVVVIIVIMFIEIFVKKKKKKKVRRLKFREALKKKGLAW
jgi:parallel beta-helix repeat protein